MNILKLNAQYKLYISLLIALGVFLVTHNTLPGPVLFMITWLGYSISSLVLSWLTILVAKPGDVMLDSKSQDSSRMLVFLFVVAATLASLFTIIVLLKAPGNVSKHIPVSQLIISLVCLLSSWWLAHTVFIFRYAHLYYYDMDSNEETTIENAGGLQFPKKAEPDYLDFAYFSFVIAMTCQVSDIKITSRKTRRVVWMHGILSFLFNAIIIALSVNIIAGLL
ncbi:DUF1345 domain-containing protein [Mucilaginibacter sp.]|uniref:DUF1345 domain-containing protein n=1 Tax=Mucilaginibacter sp. TaxID=1882438 RepID=UPI000CB2AB4D|nr:DUF1345 domain-containing protein [Mucilaginibacter sp.]PLW88720.1 MAG: DUF1345 domain-containing protein [Mucilaginibacter sp.]PMP65668.1 MAG: DUF1345 domain-containing protein [Mucilaginibacter sp.]HEK21806.1 DUF1345 domain-containing protein [Bacteroidota bacterium]